MPQREETVCRRSTRARSMSEHYVSVECRPRSSKSRRRFKKSVITEIKQEPEDNETLDMSQPSLFKSPRRPKPSTVTTDDSEITKRTRGRPRKYHPIKIKEEPQEEPSTSTDVLPTISDDLHVIQQGIKTEPDFEQKKRRKKRSFPISQGHKCEYCGRIYKYRKGMLQHQRLECGQEPQFPCPYCPVKFRYRHQIRNHVFSEHNQAFQRWYNLFYTASKLTRWPSKDSP